MSDSPFLGSEEADTRFVFKQLMYVGAWAVTSVMIVLMVYRHQTKTANIPAPQQNLAPSNQVQVSYDLTPYLAVTFNRKYGAENMQRAEPKWLISDVRKEGATSHEHFSDLEMTNCIVCQAYFPEARKTSSTNAIPPTP